MSLTLGEQLREAREEKGLSLSEVSEQTRISSLYLQSIENDDYSILPGGIFNKGFVKSYAKFVGLNEQEALVEYAKITAANEDRKADELKVYRPEVLTDDRSSQSIVPTAILAVVILGLMTAGLLFLVNYLRQNDGSLAGDGNGNVEQSANTAPNEVPAEVPEKPTGSVPEMSSLKVEFKALTEPVSLMATADGKTSSDIVAPGIVKTFEPKENLKLSYSRSLASMVELTINGRKIDLPAQPLNPRRNAIEFEINRENLATIWNTGAISTEVPSASPVQPTDENIAVVPAETNTPTPAATIAVRPSPTVTPANRATPAANTTVRPTPATTPRQTPAPDAATPRPVSPADDEP